MGPLGSVEKISPSLLFSFCHLFHISYGGFIFQSTFHLRPRLGSKFQNQDKNWLDTKVGFQVPKPSLQAFSSYLPPAFLLKSTSMHKLQNSETRISFWILVYWQKDLLEKLDSLCWLSLRTSQKRFLHFAAGLPALTSPSKTPISPCPSEAHEKQTRRLKPRQ